MYEGRKVAVLIMAAGHGTRMGEGRAKQYREIGGKTVLEHTLAAFVLHPAVDDILLVVSPEERDNVALMAVKNGGGKVQAVVTGGKERFDSVWNGLRVLGAIRDTKNDIVLVQDAARPFVSKEVIDRVLEAAKRYGAAIPCVRAKDTVKLEKEEWVKKTLPRERLALAQTPQGFDRVKLTHAMAAARRKGFRGTDDASFFEKFAGPVRIVEGDETNFKITTPRDLKTAEDIAAENAAGSDTERKEPEAFKNVCRPAKIGEGTDVHMLVPGRKLILGGVTIPNDKGLLGHSDADVLTHAVMDALLGAAGLGDIGQLFPDNDPAYEGAYSMALLEVVRRLLAKNHYSVGNVDATILCQAPKLAPFIPQMRLNFARILRIDPAQINVKATTTERLGFIGRGEGISANAIVTLLEDTVERDLPDQKQNEFPKQNQNELPEEKPEPQPEPKEKAPKTDSETANKSKSTGWIYLAL